MPEDAEQSEALWKRHEFLDGLYRFYLDQIISFHKFYLPVVGGLVAYVLNNRSEAIAFGLVIPLIVSLGACVIFCSGVKEAKELNAAIADSAGSLGILATHARMLVRATAAFLVLHIAIVIALVWLGGAMMHFWHLPGRFPPSSPNGYSMTPHNLAHALADLPELQFKQFASFNGGAVGVFRTSAGVSPWERHPKDDELLHVLEGEAEITVITPDGWRTAVVTAGSIFVVPHGLWHRHTIKEKLVELFVTPGATAHSTAEDPTSPT